MPVSNEIKQKILTQYLQSPAGRHKLAASMVKPIRSQRDYFSVGRRAFEVDPLPDGEQPLYPVDPDVKAYIISEGGEEIVSFISTNENIMVPLFEIASLPEIPLTQVKSRRYDVVDRLITKARSEINSQEDTKIFGVILAAALAAGAPNPVLAVTAPLTPESLADAFGEVEAHDLRVARIFVNFRDYTDFRKWDNTVLDYETQGVLLKTGLMGTIWGAQIIASRIVPVGNVLVCAEPEFFGRIPVRMDVVVLSADDPRARTIGFSCFENIGVAMTNAKGVSLLTIARP